MFTVDLCKKLKETGDGRDIYLNTDLKTRHTIRDICIKLEPYLDTLNNLPGFQKDLYWLLYKYFVTGDTYLKSKDKPPEPIIDKYTYYLSKDSWLDEFRLTQKLDFEQIWNLPPRRIWRG